MTLAQIALLACLPSTLFMAGVIAFVQVVHYPLFRHVEPSRFPIFHDEHSRRTCLVVIPPVLAELLSSLLMVFKPTPHAPFWLVAAGFLAAATTWLATFLLSVPIHERLGAKGSDPREIDALVGTNVVRFIAWQGHALIVLAINAMEWK